MRLTRVVLLLVSIAALSPASALAAHNLTISTAADSGLTVTSSPGTTTVASSSDDANLSVTSLVGYLNAGNVVVNTGSDGSQTGDLTVANNVTPAGTGSLSLSAAGTIKVGANISAGAGTPAIDFASPVVLTADTTLAASGGVRFQGRVNGAFNLTVSASTLTLGEAIGMSFGQEAGVPIGSLSAAGVPVDVTGVRGGNIHATGPISVQKLDLRAPGATSEVVVWSSALTVGSGGLLADRLVTLEQPGGVAQINGPLSGPGFVQIFAGSLAVPDVGLPASGYNISVSGPLRVDMDTGLNVYGGGVLSGSGSVARYDTTGMSTPAAAWLSTTFGTIAPGPGVATLTTNFMLNANALSSIDLDLNGGAPGSYDQIIGDGFLGGAHLNLTIGGVLPVGQPLTIIDGLGVSGTFAGLPEGAQFYVGDVLLTISYVGGASGTNVTLTRLKLPTSIAVGATHATEAGPVTATATVTGPSGHPKPSGSVEFKSGTTVLGTAPLTNGVATLQASPLATGAPVTATLTGSDYATSAATAAVDSAPAVQTQPEQGSADPQSSPAPSAEQAQLPPDPPALVAPLPGPDITHQALKLSVADVSVRKPRRPTFMTFTVRLSTAAATPVKVAFKTANGTAKAGTDFRAKSGSLTFEAGQTKLTVAIPLMVAKPGNKTKRFFLRLSKPLGAALQRTSATGSIRP